MFIGTVVIPLVEAAAADQQVVLNVKYVAAFETAVVALASVTSAVILLALVTTS